MHIIIQIFTNLCKFMQIFSIYAYLENLCIIIFLCMIFWNEVHWQKFIMSETNVFITYHIFITNILSQINIFILLHIISFIIHFRKLNNHLLSGGIDDCCRCFVNRRKWSCNWGRGLNWNKIRKIDYSSLRASIRWCYQ